MSPALSATNFIPNFSSSAAMNAGARFAARVVSVCAKSVPAVASGVV
jgi:hypothetical protein